MASPRVRSDYESLQRIAAAFVREAENAQRTLGQLQSRMGALQSGQWVGKGADKFYREMESDILPAMKRLVNALQTASGTTNQISRVMKEAEGAASSLFRLDGVGDEAAKLAAAGGPISGPVFTAAGGNGQTIGAVAGGVAGGVAGAVVAGPVGGLVGAVAGAYVGGEAGKAVESGAVNDAANAAASAAGVARDGMREGVGNIIDHVGSGVGSWLGGGLGDANILTPNEANPGRVINTVAGVLGVTEDRIEDKARRRFGDQAVDTMEHGVQTAGEAIAGGPAGVWDGIRGGVGDAGNAAVDVAGEASVAGPAGVWDGIRGSVGDVGSAAGNSADAARRFMKDIFDKNDAVRGAIIGGATGAGADATPGMTGAAGDAANAAAGAVGDAVNDAANAAGDAADNAGGAVNETASNVGDAANDAANAVGSLF